MLLSTGDKVLQAMGVQSTPTAVANAVAALNLAFPMIESILESKLEYGRVADHYNYVYLGTALKAVPVELRLTNRFIVPGTLTVKVGDPGLPITSRDFGTVLGTEYYLVNAEDGVVSILPGAVGYPSSASFYIEYKYGADAPTSGREPDLPEWVRQAAITAAVAVMSVYPSIPGNRNTKTMVDVTRALHGSLVMQLQGYRRPRATVVFPDVSEQLSV